MKRVARGVGLVACLLALSGCADDDAPEREGAATRPSTETAAATPPPTERISYPPARRIRVPPGFRAEVYASGLDRPTAMAWGPDQRLYVTEETGDVVAVRPRTKAPRTFASGFPTPLGLTWRGRTLFVSAQGRLERLRLSGGGAVGRRTIVPDLPFGRHQQDNVVVGADGRLYFGSGSTCDVCDEADPRSATILSVRPDGSGLRVVATGLRNPFGLAFQPGTRRLYATVNGQDNLPDPSAPEPAETLVLVREGADYGWPRCWPSALRQRLVGDCAGVEEPVAYLETHSSADGLAFYTGTTFPARYRAGAFVALWGQYESTDHGRRVDFVRLNEDGSSPKQGVQAFARGFEHPLALAVDPQGALLVADWGPGVIYRIQAKGAP